MLVYVLFGDSLLEWIGGQGFAAAHTVLVMIAGSQVISLLGFPLASALQATGRPGVVLRVNLIAMAVLFPILIALLHYLGLVGAGLYALSLSTLVVGILGVLWFRALR